MAEVSSRNNSLVSSLEIDMGLRARMVLVEIQSVDCPAPPLSWRNGDQVS